MYQFAHVFNKDQGRAICGLKFRPFERIMASTTAFSFKLERSIFHFFGELPCFLKYKNPYIIVERTKMDFSEQLNEKEKENYHIN